MSKYVGNPYLFTVFALTRAEALTSHFTLLCGSLPEPTPDKYVTGCIGI
ncbi:hypothetical protein [Photobacterium sp. GSS17]|nr:hypothetical protein [Photobacterium sp. GSS17]